MRFELDPLTPAELLEPHAHRTIRAFLTGRGTDRLTEEAFWSLIFTEPVDHAVAVACARELVTSPVTIGDLLRGWKPEALGARERVRRTAKQEARHAH